MGTKAQLDREFLDELQNELARYRPRRRGLDPEILRILAGAILKRSDPHTLLAGEGRGWLRWAEELLSFIARRPPESILVKISPPVEAEPVPYSVLSTCTSDQPFIVDTIRLCLQQREVELRDQLNLVVPAGRGPHGRILALGGEQADQPLESITRFEIAPQEDPKRREALEEEIRERLKLARAMSADFRRMLRRLKDVINQYEFLLSLHPERREEIREARSFLEWVADDHLVFMGIASLGQSEGGRLGLHRMREDPFLHSYPDSRAFARARPNPTRTLTPARSSIAPGTSRYVCHTR